MRMFGGFRGLSPEQFVEVVGGLHLLLPARPQLAADGGEAAEDALDHDL